MFTLLQYIKFIILKFNRINTIKEREKEREGERFDYTGNIKTLSQALLFFSCFNLHSHLLNPGKSEFCLVEI